MKKRTILGVLLVVALSACTPSNPPAVLYNAFSHNDEANQRPLTAALENRFNNIEVDAYLIDGNFYVAHDRPDDLSQLKTLDEMYLTPLFERIKKNGGAVYSGSDRPFYLMIDIKEQGDDFYTALKPLLEKHRDMFCGVEEGKFRQGPILLFFSGSRPMNTLPAETSRLAFLDGTFADLERETDRLLMPVVSDDFKAFFAWQGQGPMPQAELDKMRELIGKAHAGGRMIRFWGAPDTEDAMQVQREEKVDMIGTDRLEVLHRLLSGQK